MIEQAEREAAIEAEQKAKHDARYAARKKRRRRAIDAPGNSIGAALP